MLAECQDMEVWQSQGLGSQFTMKSPASFAGIHHILFLSFFSPSFLPSLLPSLLLFFFPSFLLPFLLSLRRLANVRCTLHPGTQVLIQFWPLTAAAASEIRLRKQKTDKRLKTIDIHEPCLFFSFIYLRHTCCQTCSLRQL